MPDKVDKLNIVKSNLVKLLEYMGVEAEVTAEENNENIDVLINTKDAQGLLIGRRGETIYALQTILGIIYKNQTGEWTRIVVNVGDWREKQEDYYHGLAFQAAERVRTTGESQTLYNLNPTQRRMVHMALADQKDVETESQGEGEERYLVIKPSKK